MNTCDTCKHWKPVDWAGVKYGHECSSGKIDEPIREQEEDDLFYRYTEGGGFTPGPKFGCIHHEPKEEA